jgi:fructose-1,6-bisphosphatase/inositol monophosphatase family enzyme
VGYREEMSVAKDLALQAGDIMLHYFDGDQQEQTKSDGTPVTIADTTINSLVIKTISEKFPNDGVVGEEESTADYGSGRRWIVDPIDGTAAQVMGLPSAMFSLGLVIDGVPVLGVAYEPHSKKMYTAELGQGSFCNDVKLQVSMQTIKNGLIALAPDFMRPQHVDEIWLRRLLAHDKQLAIFPGAVFRGCMVASGRIAGFPHPSVKPYDIAAVHIILIEAGGKVTDVHGNPLDYSRDFQGAILSNGVVHDDLVALFK